MTKGKIVVLLGRSGSGKDFLMKKLLKEYTSLNLVTSYTTRPVRKGEVNGVDYHFVTNDEIHQMIKDGDMLEWTSYNTVHGEWIYSVHKLSFSNDTKDFICVLDYKGFKRVASMYPKRIVGFDIQLDYELRKQNYINRGGSLEEFNRREIEDDKKFKSCENDFSIYHVVNNYERTEDTIKTMKLLIKGE